MVDADTFVIWLYVMADDFCKQHLRAETHPGPAPALCRSEVMTLALVGQWFRFGSEAGFWRYADRHLRCLFPRLPVPSQLNRAIRAQQEAITRFGLHLAEQVTAQAAAYEAIDCTAAPTRNAKRRGRGWLPGLADIGFSNRLGWYHGFCPLIVAAPNSAITGFGFGPASTNDRTLAETFFAARAAQHPRLPSCGQPQSGIYVADTGFAGEECTSRWKRKYGAVVLAAPQRDSGKRWSKRARRWAAGLRQIVETVNNHLLFTFRLERDRPHDLSGFRARLAAKVALHNFCLWLNAQLGRPLLSFADLIDW
jgi:hypothetical protein